VKKWIFCGCSPLLLALSCVGQTQQALCPKHIETPDYPAVARAAHVTGKFTMTATIDADGNVTNVEATTDDSVARAHPLLQKYAVANLEQWTFVKPPYAPYTQAVVYDYELSAGLPASGGRHNAPVVTKVAFDLPDRVTIRVNPPFIEPEASRESH
jgi:hypothetical protein